MIPRVKICGLTRPEDVAFAVESGASFVGVIFAGGPRSISPERARTVLEPAAGKVARVGVFRTLDPVEISAVAGSAGLDVAQLHGEPATEEVRRIREHTGLAVWAVVRVRGSSLPDHLPELFEAADAVLLETYVPGLLGGTGQQLPWRELGAELLPVRPPGSTMVLAGGLNPENVARASAELSPDIVDVSSGVELEPGVKDHELIRTFVAAARGAL